jgi:hypothetical protein
MENLNIPAKSKKTKINSHDLFYIMEKISEMLAINMKKVFELCSESNMKHLFYSFNDKNIVYDDKTNKIIKIENKDKAPIPEFNYKTINTIEIRFLIYSYIINLRLFNNIHEPTIKKQYFRHIENTINLLKECFYN